MLHLRDGESCWKFMKQMNGKEEKGNEGHVLPDHGRVKRRSAESESRKRSAERLRAGPRDMGFASISGEEDRED